MKEYTNLFQLQESLKSGESNCQEQVDTYINRIQDKQHLNAFLEVFEESARAKAKEVDQKIQEKREGKLAGLIVAIKDNICYQGHSVSASSKILQGFESLFSSTVVERLLQEDAIIIGRTNCDEFAMGSSNESSYYGPVKNPLDLERVSGGSSGGSAAAVAADLCMLALGSDTGGSIRQPASFCGIYGLKPTYGRVSRHGLLAFASSFDQIGPLAKSVEDIALVMEVIAGKDEYDSTLSQREVPMYSKRLQVEGKPKIAYLDCYIEHEGIDDEVRSRTVEVINQLKEQGHQVDKLSFDYLDELVPTYYVLTTAEASSNLARYDGIHFGYRSDQASDLESTYVKSRTEGFGKEVKRRIMLGTYVLSSGYYDAYYSKAQKVRQLVKQKTDEVFKEYDFIISPTSPHVAFKIGAQSEDQIKMYLEDIFTAQAPLSGVPAISLPLGENSNGLPFGIQLMSSAFSEEKLFAFSAYLMNSLALKKD